MHTRVFGICLRITLLSDPNFKITHFSKATALEGTPEITWYAVVK